MGSGSKGSAKERELVNEFEDAGWFARRAGASGAGTDSESYDIIAAKEGRVMAIELKYSDPDNIVYLDPEEVRALEYVAKQFGGTAFVVARWKQDTTFYAYIPEMLPRTDGGNIQLHEKKRDEADIHLPPAKP